MNSEQFLKYDDGGKHSSIDVKCQPELKTMIRKLAAGQSMSQYCREALIVHVRKQLEDNNPRLKGDL